MVDAHSVQEGRLPSADGGDARRGERRGAHVLEVDEQSAEGQQRAVRVEQPDAAHAAAQRRARQRGEGDELVVRVVLHPAERLERARRVALPVVDGEPQHRQLRVRHHHLARARGRGSALARARARRARRAAAAPRSEQAVAARGGRTLPRLAVRRRRAVGRRRREAATDHLDADDGRRGGGRRLEARRVVERQPRVVPRVVGGLLLARLGQQPAAQQPQPQPRARRRRRERRRHRRVEQRRAVAQRLRLEDVAAAAIRAEEAARALQLAVVGLVVEGHQLRSRAPQRKGVVVGRADARAVRVDAREVRAVVELPVAAHLADGLAHEHPHRAPLLEARALAVLEVAHVDAKRHRRRVGCLPERRRRRRRRWRLLAAWRMCRDVVPKDRLS